MGDNTCIIMLNNVDVIEDEIFQLSAELFNTLLKDNTKSKEGEQCNIFWATSDYEHLGIGYDYNSPIYPELITKEHGKVIMPRVLKHKDTQITRSKDMAEVFTPPWICNAQNNLIDNAWFDRESVFNRENEDHTWTVNADKIYFPPNKSWRKYVKDTRLEITCGEAPYIVSRYDTTTGNAIPIQNRIGLLDRKLRIVSENTDTSKEWLKWAKEAYKSIYAYEWQGDNLLLAREAMLISFIEYYKQKFKKMPLIKSVRCIADIISWNVWQMDGLRGVVPNSCGEKQSSQLSLFDLPKMQPCNGCKSNDIHNHNGIYCLIKDWNAIDAQTGKKGKIIRFIDLIK